MAAKVAQEIRLGDLFVKEGLITEEEALKNADSANNVRLKIKFAKEGGAEDDGALSFSLESLNEDEGRVFEG